MLWVIVFGECVLEIGVVVDGLGIVVVGEGLGRMVGGTGGGPDLIIELELFTLFKGGIGVFSIGAEASISNSFVEHEIEENNNIFMFIFILFLTSSK